MSLFKEKKQKAESVANRCLTIDAKHTEVLDTFEKQQNTLQDNLTHQSLMVLTSYHLIGTFTDQVQDYI